MVNSQIARRRISFNWIYRSLSDDDPTIDYSLWMSEYRAMSKILGK